MWMLKFDCSFQAIDRQKFETFFTLIMSTNCRRDLEQDFIMILVRALNIAFVRINKWLSFGKISWSVWLCCILEAMLHSHLQSHMAMQFKFKPQWLNFMNRRNHEERDNKEAFIRLRKSRTKLKELQNWTKLFKSLNKNMIYKDDMQMNVAFKVILFVSRHVVQSAFEDIGRICMCSKTGEIEERNRTTVYLSKLCPSPVIQIFPSQIP